MRESRFIGEIDENLIERKGSSYAFGRSSSFGNSIYGGYSTSGYSSNRAGAGYSTTSSFNKPKTSLPKPSFENKTAAPKITYAIGERVKHKTFGEGMITSVIPMGNDSMLEIAFDMVGTKKVMANFAKLEKI